MNIWPQAITHPIGYFSDELADLAGNPEGVPIPSFT